MSGHLSESWSDHLQGMSIRLDRDAGNHPVAILEGRLPDQAALSGVLESLYDLHLPVLSVELLQSDGRPATGTDGRPDNGNDGRPGSGESTGTA
ncbi:MAG: hypothetical protein P8177_08170 [Gemmatimonadota bacterium]